MNVKRNEKGDFMKKIFIFKETKVAVKGLSLFVIAASVLFLGSCVYMTPMQVLEPDHVPIDGDGYIYCRFFTEDRNFSDDNNTIGVVVQNIDTLEKYNFLMKLDKDAAIQMSAVPPGKYRMDSFEGITTMGEAHSVDEFDFEGYQRDFVVEPNTAVYLGDFSGTVDESIRSSGNMIIHNVMSEYYSPIDNYRETTLDIQEKYPFLNESNIPFVSNMKTPEIPEASESAGQIAYLYIESQELQL